MNTEQTITITPFEEQLLQTFEDGHEGSHIIRFRGILQYGPEWGGSAQARKYSSHRPTYPKINMALGRLAAKGLVERKDWANMNTQGYRAGIWSLTDGGKLLLGIE